MYCSKFFLSEAKDLGNCWSELITLNVSLIINLHLHEYVNYSQFNVPMDDEKNKGKNRHCDCFQFS